MKRVLVAVMLFLALSSVFAIDEIDTNLQIWGYYNSAASSVTLQVKDYNDTQLYETNAFVSASHLGNSASKIFSWAIKGKFGNSCTVKFTFTVLQAYVNGTYYRPGYSIIAEKPTSTANNDFNNNKYSFSGTNLTSTSSPSGGGTKTYSTKATSAQPFSETFAYSFKFTRQQNSQVTRSGNFNLKITDYESDVSGTFNYRCNVTVEFTTN